MKRLLVAWLLVLCGAVGLGAGTAAAQYIPPSKPNYGVGYQPLLDPALNLLRTSPTNNIPGQPVQNNTTGFTIDYFLGQQPETQRRSQYIESQQETQRLERGLGRNSGGSQDETDQLLSSLPGTGHATAFNNTGGYFNNNRISNSVANARRLGQQAISRPPSRQ